jgi:hypothetical protein
MATQRRGLGRILPVATLLAALVGSCTEPRDAVEKIDPNQTQTTEQSDEQVAQQVDNGWPRNPSPNIPTTEERVHVGRDEFEISGPYTHENLEVFLLHNKSPRAPRRKVMTLEEAMRQNKVKVHETGDVEQLAIENLTTDTDIWVQSGDIVQGGKQDRVLSQDLLVPPKSGKMPLASFCVEQGRWSGRSSETLRQARLVDAAAVGLGSGVVYKSAGFGSSRNAISSKELKKAVRLASAQQEVWNEVSNAQTNLSRNIGDNVVLEYYATGRGQQVNDRMQSIVVDGKSVVFSETRDKQADSSWVHRSYFAK